MYLVLTWVTVIFAIVAITTIVLMLIFPTMFDKKEVGRGRCTSKTFSFFPTVGRGNVIRDTLTSEEINRMIDPILYGKSKRV